MKRKLTIAVMALLLTLGLSSAAAHADTVTVTLTNPVQFIAGDAGGTLTYDVDIVADASNTGDVFLNAGDFSGGGGLILDSDDFFANAPFFLMPGQDSGPFDAFTVTVPAGTIPGNYSGFFIVLGGADGNAQNVLGQNTPGGEAFVTTVTPEPSSFILLGTGLAGAFTTLKRKRFSNV